MPVSVTLEPLVRGTLKESVTFREFVAAGSVVDWTIEAVVNPGSRT